MLPFKIQFMFLISVAALIYIDNMALNVCLT